MKVKYEIETITGFKKSYETTNKLNAYKALKRTRNATKLILNGEVLKTKEKPESIGFVTVKDSKTNKKYKIEMFKLGPTYITRAGKTLEQLHKEGKRISVS